MKKLISLILAILTLSCAISVVGCGSDVKTYTITLDANGGTVSTKTISIQVGQSYELPTPEMKGFTFKTWMLNSSKIAQKGVWNIESDVNLVAVYEGIEYKVDIYDALNKFIMNTTVAYGEPYEIKFPSDVNDIVKGLKLKGTEEDIPLKGDYWPYANDTELEVVFKEVTVVFNLNGGTADFAIEVPVEYGKIFDVSLYIPTKTGAVFEYWTYGNLTFSIVNPRVWDIPKERVELKAKWRTYTNNH
jgi:uncharacterized lipoprotein YehR (DUF1307 family)